MSTQQYIEAASEAVSSYFPRFINHGPTPYIFGLGATILGVIFGSLYTDNESFIEFQNHLDKESYFQEMKQLFLKKDQFFELLKILVVFIVGIFFVIFIFTIILAVKLFNVNKLLSRSLKDVDDRLQSTENVIESILKDNEVIDVEKLGFFRKEIEQQRISFNDLITNKALELETKISDAKSTCLKIKNNVHSDMLKFQSYVERIKELKMDIVNINDSLTKTKSSSQNLENEVAQFTKDVNHRMNESIKLIDDSIVSLNNRLKDQDVDICKCNSLLINSQILFEASIAKFELIESINKDDGKSTVSQERIISCLKSALEINEHFKNSNEVNSDYNDSTTESSKLMSELPLTTGFIEKNPYSNSINSLLFEFMKRLSNIEEKLLDHNSLINNNSNKIKNLDLSTNDKISDLKFYSDEWIISWVSVIYGLFNSSFLHLENQLFGIDCLEYTTIFDIGTSEIENNSELFYDIMDKCKQKCLKVIKEVNLLIFEYYLVQKSYSNNKSSLLALCYAKIDEELTELFESFQISINNSKITKTKLLSINNTLFKLKHDLTSDLKDDTQRFNSLVKQNLDDFYIIHDTMKSIFRESSSNPVKEDTGDDDSIIEISEHSNSLLSSSHEDSSFSENDSSILPDNLSEASLRPFKLLHSFNKAKRSTSN